MMDKLWKEISKVYKSFNDDLVAIEKYIEESIPVDSPPVLYDASRHLITIGGKRIRPVLTPINQSPLRELLMKFFPSLWQLS